MAMEYARARGDAVLHDTALARGHRIKAWIEASATTRLGTQAWAMCGGTAFWASSTPYARMTRSRQQWSRPTKSPCLVSTRPATGTARTTLARECLSCSAELGHDTLNWMIHHYLVDTLLMHDHDDDGGIPATWTDPDTMDQTWVSSYLDFMAWTSS